MKEAPRNVLLLAGRLGLHDDGWSIGGFLDRLEGLGVSPQVVCLEAAGDAAAEERVVAAPGLGHPWRQPLAVRGLRFGERLNRPDLIHVLRSNMSAAGLAVAEYWGIPYVQTVDEFPPPSQRLRLSRRWCRRLIPHGHELADELRTGYHVPEGLIAEVNPGIEAPEAEPARRAGPRVAVIGTAGPLVAASGFATFLAAARRVVDAGIDAEFVIAGQGADEVDLRRRADRLRIADRVTFAGIPVVGLRFWNVLDVFCQPSLVPSVGRTLATALAFGVPAIASDIAGLRSLVRPSENGLRVPPGESSALAAAILGLLADPAHAEELGRQGRALILRDYRPEDEAAKLVAIYQDAVVADAATLAPTTAAGG